MEHNGLYNNARTLFALGEISWKPKGSKVKALLVDPTKYIPDFTKHKNISDIPIKAIIENHGKTEKENMPSLQLITAIDGICDSSDITFDGIKSGEKIGFIILFLDNKDNDLICCLNIGGKNNYFISSGRPITIGWSNTENKIFKL